MLDIFGYGKLGRAGLNVLKERQYSNETLVDGALEGALTRILGLLKLQPHRELPMIPLGMQRVIVASDAAQDAPRQGSAGSLVVDGPGQRFAYVMDVTEDLFCLWSNDEAKIAQLELMIVLMTIGHAIEHFRGQPGIWWIDNIAALMAVVRGRSTNSELDQMAGAIHAILYSAKCPMFFEWVHSPDNWSDGISRQGIHDEWYQQHGFAVIPDLRDPPNALHSPKHLEVREDLNNEEVRQLQKEQARCKGSGSCPWNRAPQGGDGDTKCGVTTQPNAVRF